MGVSAIQDVDVKMRLYTSSVLIRTGILAAVRVIERQNVCRKRLRNGARCSYKYCIPFGTEAKYSGSWTATNISLYFKCLHDGTDCSAYDADGFARNHSNLFMTCARIIGVSNIHPMASFEPK